MSGYDDILRLPRPASSHPRMPVQDRAAQFSPFAALTGHEAAMGETARETQERVEISEDVRQGISHKLTFLLSDAGKGVVATITWFAADARKAGGSYVQTAGVIARLDDLTQVLTLTSGEKIAVSDVRSVELLPTHPASALWDTPDDTE